MPASRARRERRRARFVKAVRAYVKPLFESSLPDGPLEDLEARRAVEAKEDAFIKRFLDGPRFQVGRWCEHEGVDASCPFCSPSDGEACTGASGSVDAWRLWKLAPDVAQAGRVCWQPVRMAHPRRVAEAVAGALRERNPPVKGEEPLKWPMWRVVHVSKVVEGA